jgi:hypothetical protein
MITASGSSQSQVHIVINGKVVVEINDHSDAESPHLEIVFKGHRNQICCCPSEYPGEDPKRELDLNDSVRIHFRH